MIKDGIFHPELNLLLSEVRHMDTIVIGDAGLPIPKEVKRIDLGWIQNQPRFHSVLEEINKVIIVEKATFAEEALSTNGKEYNDKSISLLPDSIPIDFIPHQDLKDRSKEAKAIILTGEFTPYTNVILTIGCAY